MAQLRKVIPSMPSLKKAVPTFIPYWRLAGTVYHWRASGRGLRVERFDRSVHASDRRVGIDSISGRLSKVNLRPFDPVKMKVEGGIVTPTLGHAEAEGILSRDAVHAMHHHPVGAEFQHGSVVGPRLSLVWFPYWVLDLGKVKVIVDGTGGGVAGRPGRVLPHKRSNPVTYVPSLLAARCPGCQHALDLDGFEGLFFCAHCQSGWKLDGETLKRQAFRLAAPDKGRVEPGVRLPLWRLRIRIDTGRRQIKDRAEFRQLVPAKGYGADPTGRGAPFYLYVPAWGNRRAPRVSVVAKRWTREQPAYDFNKETRFKKVFRPVHGPREAQELAVMALLGSMHGSALQGGLLLGSKLHIDATELLLLPCARGTHEWIESVTGLAEPYAELAERSFDRH